MTVVFDVSKCKMRHQLFLIWRTFTPILIFHAFSFSSYKSSHECDRQTSKQTKWQEL